MNSKTHVDMLHSSGKEIDCLTQFFMEQIIISNFKQIWILNVVIRIMNLGTITH